MVYYRKYRPQTISELDLESVRTRLTSILSAKELPHALLFTGPKGLGKTSSARILAKAINCEKRGKGIEPCNACDVCISITKGSNIDVIEIDAASNRGIDEIRDLREKIKFSPSNLSKKVYIIDEVHMLTTDAFNALLKTLEEPPDHAVFVLCTTELEKVPPTIVSRAFHVQFQKPTLDEIKTSLQRIVKGENLKVDGTVLDEVYKISEGSFRDAAKILEDLSFSSNGEEITKEIFNKIYKVPTEYLNFPNFLRFIANRNITEALKSIDELAKVGVDFKVLTENLAKALHEILMVRAGILKDGLDITEFKTGEVKDLLDRVNQSYEQIKSSVLPQIPLELVVVGYCLENTSEPKIQVSAQIEKTTEPVIIEVTEEKNQPVIEVVEDKPEVANNLHGVLFQENSKPEHFFAAFLGKVKADNHSIAGILRGCRLVGIENGAVNFETRFKFHHDKLTDAKINTILDLRASEILAEKVHVVVNLVNK